VISRARHVLAAFALAAIGSVVATTPVAAECPYIPPYPGVIDASGSAREIVVGTVLENVGGQFYDFRLRIDEVIRGSARPGQVRRITDLQPKWPVASLADGTRVAPCEAIGASTGNVIALAFDALAPDGATRYNAISWISGTPELRHPDQYTITTVAELSALGPLPPTDTASVPEATSPSGQPSARDVSLFGLAVSAAVVVLLRLTVRRPAGPRSTLPSCRPDE
jgi:hypothetical protein